MFLWPPISVYFSISPDEKLYISHESALIIILAEIVCVAFVCSFIQIAKKPNFCVVLIHNVEFVAMNIERCKMCVGWRRLHLKSQLARASGWPKSIERRESIEILHVCKFYCVFVPISYQFFPFFVHPNGPIYDGGNIVCRRYAFCICTSAELS